MHLVFVTSLVPEGEPTTGYEIANHSLVDALRRNGVRVTSIGFSWVGRTKQSAGQSVILKEMDVRSETAGASDKASWVVTALTNSLTISSAKLRVVGEAEIRAALQRLEPFDGYVVNGVTLAGAFQGLFQDKPSLYVAHNVEFQSAEENARSADSAIKRMFFRREAKLLRTLEITLTSRAACTLALADEDRAPLGVLGKDRSVVLPLVTNARIADSSSPRAIEFDAGLIGTWTWQPNRVGLEWFLQEVVRYLPQDFRIGLAGHVPEAMKHLPAQVRLLGRVTDAAAFVQSCAVIPLVSRSGTGVQLKTIETFELGLPSVATSHSLRGITGIPANCLVSDDPAAFANALVEQAKAARSGQLAPADGEAFRKRQLALQDVAVRAAIKQLRLQLVRKAA